MRSLATLLLIAGLSPLLGGCPAATIGAAAASIFIPPLLEAGQDTAASAEALLQERNERRSAVRHGRYRAEDAMCETIKNEIAKTDDFAKRVALHEMSVDCENRHYPGLLEGDIFTGLREGDERPRIEMDLRPMSERAAELQGEPVPQ